jgi:hypothetical protein
MVEHRQDGTDLFAGILEMMTTLRQEIEAEQAPDPEHNPSDLREAQREAFMRQTIRQAQAEGFQKIAVVCGAWHAPVLANMPYSAKEDATTLKNLPKAKVAATWVPWTYGRFSFNSGYGAGVESPGWYHHLWTAPSQIVIRWLTHVAQLLRSEDLDASSASVIEAVRLAETLAALRGVPLPGLAELNEATQTVLCFGNDTPMRLIHERLIVGERLGEVPAKTPMIPLQQDLTREQKRLRFAPSATQALIDLDLRKPNELERSLLLHRLALLGVAWGKPERGGRKTGTFHEFWRVQWQPEFVVKLIEMGVWGNTVRDAASNNVRHAANEAKDLPALSALLDHTLLADLPDAANHLMLRIQDEAALASDIAHLMNALPALAQILRYGNVRQTDTKMVGHIVAGLVARICVGLPGACGSLNDDAASAMFAQLNLVNEAISLLQIPEHLSDWQQVLEHLSDQENLHGLVAGRCCRILLEAGRYDADEAARRLSLALSTAIDPHQAAAWLEGFLKGSGLLLLLNEVLWQVLDDWVTQLPSETFQTLLPLLRRTFATFPTNERHQMGERVKRGSHQTTTPGLVTTGSFDVERAEAMLPLVAQLLGLK